VLKYIKGTCEFEISFLRLEKRQKVKGYVNLNYARDYTNYKLTYKFVFILLKGSLA
jgi:hypothetical protein